MTKTTVSTYILFILILATRVAGADEWSRFRGPNGSGVKEVTGIPLEFGPDKNVVWKTSLPVGYSSPVLTEDRIFLTASEGKTLLTLCLDRKTGKVLWSRESPRDREEKIDKRNHPAAPTAATDGENVYVFFCDYGILSYDLEGNERWRHPLGPFDNTYGMGTSPILAADKVLLVCDQNTDSYVIALGKKDGRVHWKTDRPEAGSGHSTPILYEPAEGGLQLIVPGSFLLSGYSVESGERVWWVSGLNFEMKSTPVMGKGTVYINGYGAPFNDPGNQVAVAPFAELLEERDADGDGRLSKEEVDERARSWFDIADLDKDGFSDSEEWGFYRAAMASTNGILAIRAGGRGDMSESSVLWQYHRSVPQLPSPLLYRDVLYMVNDGGIATSFRPESGEVIARGRLEGAVDKYYASPVAADGKVFMISEQGKVSVLKPDGSLESIVVNDLDDLCYATPAIGDDGRIYLRTRETMYCFGKR